LIRGEEIESKVNLEPGVAKILGIGHPSGRGKRLKRWLVAAFLLIGVVTTAAIWKTADKSNTAQFKTQEVRRGSLTVIVTATGTLQSTNKVDVGSAAHDWR
jgi:HlyD family secretion protein